MTQVGNSGPLQSQTPGGALQHQSAPKRLSPAGTGFGATAAAGGGGRGASEVAALLTAMSVRAGATLISFNRARTCGVRPGKDATGIKSGAWSLPTRMPE